MGQPAERSKSDLSGIGILVVVFYALDRLVERACALPESAYYGTTVMGGFARKIADPGIATVGLLCVVVAFVVDALWKRSFWVRWADFEYGARLRLLAITLATLLAWSFSSYSLNLYFDQGHVWDRALLVVLLLVVYWRPAGVFPFIVAVLAVANQFGHPVGQWGWSEPSLLVRILVLMLALVVVRGVQEYLPRTLRWGGRKPASNNLVLIILCLIGAFYFSAGLGKIQLNWIALDRVGYLLPATYSAGWLSFLESGTIARLTGILLALNTPIKLRHNCIGSRCGVCPAFATGHTGVSLRLDLLPRWDIPDIRHLLLALDQSSHAFLLFVFFGRNAPRFDLYRPSLRIAAVVLVLLGNYWARPTTLAWLDVPVNYAYRVTAVASEGSHVHLPPRFFEPYDYQFTLANFGPLVPDTLLGITFGAARSGDVLAALEAADSPEAVFAVEKEMGASRYNENRRARMEAFLGQFGSAWNRRRIDNPDFGEKHKLKSLLSAPTHVWTFPRSARIPPGATIDSILVSQVTSHYDGTDYREIRDRPVLSIAIE